MKVARRPTVQRPRLVAIIGRGTSTKVALMLAQVATVACGRRLGPDVLAGGPRHRPWYVALALLAVLQAGCSRGLVRSMDLLPTPLSFTLPEPLATAQGVLPPGRYYCQYADVAGYFCEAPGNMNEAYLFKGGNAGGVYLSRRRPRTAQLFLQDVHTNTVYTPDAGLITVGGSGRFRLTSVLTDERLRDIVIQGE